MGVLAPYVLMGLAALAVPIIIHLWSKNTRNSIDFGSIRFLRETETKTMRSIMPSQWLLLFLRMILIALLVVLLAEPFLERKMESVETMYLVDAKYKDVPWFQIWKDSLAEGDQAFWLCKDFPSIDQEAASQSVDYWQLLANPPKINAEKVVVISPLLMTNFQGRKAAFPINYEWMKLPVDPKEESTITYQKGDEAFQVSTTFDEWKTFNALLPASSAEPLQVSYHLEASSAYEPYQKLFETALLTLNELSALTLTSESNVEEADWIFWLSSATPPKRSNMIVIDSLNVKKWKKIGNQQVSISTDWQMADAVELNLPKKLLQLISPTIPADLDQRTMDVNSFTYQVETGIKKIQSKQENASSLFWILLLVGLVTERWASFKSEKK